MTLGAGVTEEALEAQSQSARDREQLAPMLDHGKRTRIYAVLGYASSANVSAAKALEALEQSCQRKNQEDKQLGAAVAQILESLHNGMDLGQALIRTLGRMLSVEEATILQLLPSDLDGQSGHAEIRTAMEMLLHLREIDLLEACRPQ